MSEDAAQSRPLDAAMLHPIDEDECYIMVPGGYGFKTMYVDVAMCLQPCEDDAVCLHMVRYSDGRMMVSRSDAICKMFLNRRCPVDAHFKKHLSQMRIRRSVTNVYYYSAITHH